MTEDKAQPVGQAAPGLGEASVSRVDGDVPCTSQQLEGRFGVLCQQAVRSVCGAGCANHAGVLTTQCKRTLKHPTVPIHMSSDYVAISTFKKK